MKKFEAHVADGDFAKSQQSVIEKLEAPIQLTPDQLEIVAGGFMLHLGSGTSSTTATTGLYPTRSFPKLS
jgi:hypothetical protein